MKLLVKEVAEAKGFRNAKDLADKLGMSYGTIYPLWQNQTKRIDLSTLERLCKILNVQPGMLFLYIDDELIAGTAENYR